MAMIQAIARKIDNTAPGKIIGHFYSHKTGCLQPYESVLEQLYFYLLECDESVIGYVAQPLTIKYFFEGRFRKYTPDVQLHYGTQEAISYIEVKPSGVAKFWTESGRFAAIDSAMQQLNAKLQVVTSEQITAEPMLRNAILLHRYGAIYNPVSVIRKAIDYVESNPECNVKQLSEQITGVPCGISAVYALIFNKNIRFDLCTLLSIHSALRVGLPQAKHE